MGVESGKAGAEAKNPKSSAHGLGQLVNNMWGKMGGGNRTDPETQVRNAAKLLRSNTDNFVKATGREPTPSESYTTWVLGDSTGRAVLRADPSTPVADIIKKANPKGADEILSANLSILKGKNAGDLVKWADNKMLSVAAPAVAAAPAVVAAAPTAPTAPAAPTSTKPAPAPGEDKIIWNRRIIAIVIFAFLSITMEIALSSWALDLLTERGTAVKTAVLFATVAPYFVALSRIYLSTKHEFNLSQIWRASFICVALGIGLLSEEKVPGQCVDKQAAPPKTFGYSQMAYIEINPPILLPAIKVFLRSL